VNVGRKERGFVSKQGESEFDLYRVQEFDLYRVQIVFLLLKIVPLLLLKGLQLFIKVGVSSDEEKRLVSLSNTPCQTIISRQIIAKNVPGLYFWWKTSGLIFTQGLQGNTYIVKKVVKPDDMTIMTSPILPTEPIISYLAFNSII
jgi:hypothetical protein